MATGTIILPILAATPDPTAPPGLSFTTANRPYLTFDDSTGVDELCLWTFMMPENYASAPVVKVVYSMATSTSTDTVMFAAEIMGVADGADLDTDAWDTANASAATTVPATAGLQDTLDIACTTHDGSPSALAQRTYCALRLSRDVSGGTAANGDAEVWAVSLEYTTS